MMNKDIFGLRHQANEDIQPTHEELQEFLESPKEDRGVARHQDDLTLYLGMLQMVDDFEIGVQRGLADYHIDEYKFLGVLSQSRFFNHAFKVVIEAYKYLYNKLRVLDLKKPHAFIRAIQEEIDTYDPSRKADQPKIVRLQAKLDKRNEDIEAIEKNRRDFTLELKNIAQYVHDNLVRIEKLCELSIATLGNLQADNEIEQEAIEDIKKQFKDDLRDRLQQGPVSRQFAEQLKEDFVQHSDELLNIASQDLRALMQLYKQVHDHVSKYAKDVDALAKQVEAKKGIRFEEERDVLGRIEQSFISCISDCRFEPEKTGEFTCKDEHAEIMRLKRKEMLRRVFDLLQGKPMA